MSHKATPRELEALLTACVEGGCDEAQSRRIDQLIGEDSDALAAYVDMISMHAMLQWRHWDQAGASAAVELPHHLEASEFSLIVPAPLPAPFSPAPSLFDGMGHGTVAFFPQGLSLAYLLATVIMGVGLWIASLVPVSPSVPMARELSRPVPSLRNSEPECKRVGQITGMTGCKWETKGLGIRDWGLEEETGGGGRGAGGRQIQSPIPSPQSLVALGDKFALVSGLMEITYDTGAKVILQGPVTYEVESKDGGFLSLGKLTAKVEKKVASKPEVSNPQSPIPNPPLSTIHYPLFTIKTPTATVTDLGTEFGVDVDRKGYTTSHVFRGSVKVQFVDLGIEKEGNAIVLHENESLRTEKGDLAGGPAVVMRRVSVNPQTFVRRIGKPAKVLDLLDIVADGNGAGHHRECGIDPGTGREYMLFLAQSHDGDRGYRTVAFQKLIDGVFIPRGGAKPMMLDSAGHMSDAFPQTCGKSYGLIWARAADVNVDGLVTASQFWVYSLGSGEQFMPNHRGLLCMHANAGITFNLEAMRNMYPGRRPVRFHAYAGVAKANTVTYAATFNDSMEGWDQINSLPYWGSTGGQDGGGYAGRVRDDACPYLAPPVNSILYGDLATNFGSPVLRFSYYLKSFAGSPSDGGKLYMFADCDGDGISDTVWQWTPSDTSVPHEWRQYTWTVDATADAAPVGWTRVSGSGSWANSWKHVSEWNFWSGGGSGQINNGIDTVAVSGVEPAAPPSAGLSAVGGFPTPDRSQLADIWVFVDGQLKLKRLQLRPKDGVVPVDVELGPHDRFLTLVSTDGGNGNWLDWVVFGDPVLDIASIDEDRP